MLAEVTKLNEWYRDLIIRYLMTESSGMINYRGSVHDIDFILDAISDSGIERFVSLTTSIHRIDGNNITMTNIYDGLTMSDGSFHDTCEVAFFGHLYWFNADPRHPNLPTFHTLKRAFKVSDLTNVKMEDVEDLLNEYVGELMLDVSDIYVR